MGGTNVIMAMDRWKRPLRGHRNAFDVLVAMAASSLDKPKSPDRLAPGKQAQVYFGGRDLLAVRALGYPPGSTRTKGVAHRGVQRACARLVQVGAIVMLNPPSPGNPTRWGLVLDGTEKWAVRAARPLPETLWESIPEMANNGPPEPELDVPMATVSDVAGRSANDRTGLVEAAPAARSRPVHAVWTTRNGSTRRTPVDQPTGVRGALPNGSTP